MEINLSNTNPEYFNFLCLILLDQPVAWDGWIEGDAGSRCLSRLNGSHFYHNEKLREFRDWPDYVKLRYLNHRHNFFSHE